MFCTYTQFGDGVEPWQDLQCGLMGVGLLGFLILLTDKELWIKWASLSETQFPLENGKNIFYIYLFIYFLSPSLECYLRAVSKFTCVPSNSTEQWESVNICQMCEMNVYNLYSSPVLVS